MADDDSIQYLGTTRTTPKLVSFQANTPRPVTGVVFQVEGEGEQEAQSIVFHKNDSAVVQIGRRPGGQRGGENKQEPGRAFFNCPVVSRIHAKLVFSDSGQVSSTYCNSHHGTLIRPATGDQSVKKLIPETPQQLHDGDTLTLGKSVASCDGLGAGVVRPVVARVSFLYNPPTFKPLVVPSPGRYGVSSDSDSEASSHDSDIEELPPWHNISPSFMSWVPDDEDQLDDHYSDYSECDSSMDLSSSPEPSDIPLEPIVIGAWPHSRSSSSPSVFSSSFPPIRLVPSTASVVFNEPPKVPFDDISDEEAVMFDEQPQDALKLEASVASLKTEVEKLQQHRKKYKQRFNDNIKVMTDKFANLEEKSSDINSLYTLLSDKVNENVDACQQAQAQLHVLELDMLQQQMERKDQHVDQQSKATAKALEILVAEITQLRDTVREELADKSQSVEDAKEALKKLSEQVLIQTESLKRKRTVEDEEEIPSSDIVPERPTKRRQVVKVAVQTATMGVVGAVVC
ncbi:NACHT and WD repeat domain-containing 2 [Mycena indigotica]|uniref:NACHT and WD repeat domain-containing 2 n=1 Tax=Mycena indigotica TaxID=2126181 RepID=A0A8H6W9E3_9AGAR|nr:NACHT and WD repeat domain-containing 2 [Mycena indigotica]KAF7309617.1 NACHT and WD repeat domain-containing 2 [Mycena indigotica]